MWLRSALRCFCVASPVTLSRRVGDSSDDGEDSESWETLSEISLSLSASSAARRSSSEVTRDCIFSSRFAERVVSDWGLSCSEVTSSPEKRVGVFLLVIISCEGGIEAPMASLKLTYAVNMC